MIADFPVVDADEGGLLASKKPLFLEHRFESHAIVLTEEGEHHVEMDERIGLLRQFLHQDIEVVALLGKCLCHILNTFRIGAYALTHAQQVGRGNVHITALSTCMVVPCGGIEQFHAKEMAEDSLIDERLALTHLETHRVDEHPVVDCRRRIAREQQVVEGLEQVTVVRESVPLFFLVALNQHACQLLTVELHEMVKQPIDHLLLLRGAAVVPQALNHQMLTHFLVLEHLLQDVAHIVDIRPTLQHPTEQAILTVDRGLVHDIAVESVVLLQNDSSILPLVKPTANSEEPTAKKILVTGPNANSMWAMCGDYSFPAMTFFWKKVEQDLDHPHVITLLEGLQNHKPDSVNIFYSRGCDWTEEIETKFSHVGDKRSWEYPLLHRKVDSGETANKEEALAMADSADVIIAAMGENVMLCGENRDRQGLRLPGKQQEYVEALLATGKPVILVLFGGRAQVIGDLAERCAAVIQAWYPGEEGGHAVADILYGKVSPSAKLSVSYPKEELYEPICYNYPVSQKPTANSQQSIQWPFGYGLSYTTFEYKHFLMDQSARVSSNYIELSFEVKNTGKMAATEIAQVYLSPTTDKQPLRPIQLQGFARVALEPGQTKRVEMKLYTDQFGYYSNDGHRQWNIQPGTYTVKVGASSADIRLEQDITLKGEKVTKPLRNHYFSMVEVTD